jgi:rRNA maturation RNase YbeY
MTHRKKTNLELTDSISSEVLSLKLYEQTIQNILKDENLVLSSLNIILVDDEYLRSLHRQYLQKDFYTDVMTFPIEEGEDREAEIYISLDRAQMNAKRFNIRIEEEVARLIIHGLLHLKGYDDKDEISQTEMRREEDRLLKIYWQKG